MSVQVTIAGRTYPINVEPDKVESIQKISNEIETHMQYLRDNYAIKDSQDILAMTLLEYANRLESGKQEAGEEMGLKMLTQVEELLNELR